VQKAIEAPHVPFAVLGDRRNGLDRLPLIGTLDRSTLTLLEDEVATVSHADGALVLDLHNLVDLSADVSAVLSPGDGGWESISLPPLPGQRVNTSRLRIVETRRGATGAGRR
jgi:hypothetical protein